MLPSPTATVSAFLLLLVLVLRIVLLLLIFTAAALFNIVNITCVCAFVCADVCACACTAMETAISVAGIGWNAASCCVSKFKFAAALRISSPPTPIMRRSLRPDCDPDPAVVPGRASAVVYGAFLHHHHRNHYLRLLQRVLSHDPTSSGRQHFDRQYAAAADRPALPAAVNLLQLVVVSSTQTRTP